MPSLFVFHGKDQGVRFELEGETWTIGRDAGNAVRLHDSEVSRHHAEIRRHGRAYTLVDLGSSNGTFVNGVRSEAFELATGDNLQLGNSVLLFTGAGDESTRELADKIDIVSPLPEVDRSRILSSISQAEGSRLFDEDIEGAASPWLARARGNLQVMYRTALAVSHTLDIDQLLDRILQLIFEWVEADRGCIMLVDPATGRLEAKARRNRKGVKADERMHLSQTILDYVVNHNEGVLTTDASEDERWDGAASILATGVCEAICVPMQGRYSMAGIVYIDTSIPPQRAFERAMARKAGPTKFSEEHLKLMVAIAHQAALAIEDTRHYSALVQAERLAAVGQAIASLSHHVKNILQGIRGASWLIKDGLQRHDENMIKKGWEFVEKHQDRISNLVLDMLTFSKEREPERVLADMNAVVADVVELMQSRAAEKKVELRFTPAPHLPQLTFDPEGIERAVLNVVTNAIDACERGDDAADAPPGRVDVAVQHDSPAGKLRVVVSDNGVGIPPDEIEQAFSLFVSHKGSRGTGLGLPVSQKIVREHGGEIYIASELGKGSRFTLEIPANDEPEPAPNE